MVPETHAKRYRWSFKLQRFVRGSYGFKEGRSDWSILRCLSNYGDPLGEEVTRDGNGEVSSEDSTLGVWKTIEELE